MLDTIQASLHHTNGYAYFFKGDKYMKWEPGVGVKPTSDGRAVRNLGVDGWTSLPAAFKTGIDAAFYYPSRNAVYFFKGDKYVKWVQGTGAIPTADGRITRDLGVDGWTTLPAAFKRGFDAVIHHEEQDHTYFFKAATYVKWKPGSGAVLYDGSTIRQLGEDGWTQLPTGFKDGVDAAMYYRENKKIYFFKDRWYARWNPGVGTDPRYPRRIGLRHGDNMDSGWPELSHIVSGPLAGATTPHTTSVWLWLADEAALTELRYTLNGVATTPAIVEKVDRSLLGDLHAIHPRSLIREFRFSGLLHNATNRIGFVLGHTEVEQIVVRTPPHDASTGDVDLAFASCLKFSNHVEEAPVIRAMGLWDPDLTLLCGDNCYYVEDGGTETTGSGGEAGDWDSTRKMLKRQQQARNHPELADMAQRGAVLSTWDDHDFGFNNNCGVDHKNAPNWVKRDAAGMVYRAMWPNAYAQGTGSIEHHFRWGPVHVFMPDARYNKDTHHAVIWGDTQLQGLLDALRASNAPVKLIVTAGQFLYNPPKEDGGEEEEEGHESEARGERDALIAAIRNSDGGKAITGKVLFLSGDVHFTEFRRAAVAEGGRILEFTSSAAKRGSTSDYPLEDAAAGDRFWASRNDTFGGVRISVQNVIGDRVIGTITVEARGADGEVLMDTRMNIPCRSVWDLDTDAIN